MLFTPLYIHGAFLIEPELKEDDRGYFTRTFCKQEFLEVGIATEFVQSNLCHTKKAGTLRGMHYQLEPHAEDKLIRCSSGSIYDVMVDLRPDSDTHCKWYGVRLQADDPKLIYVPKGCAHGYLTLSDDCLVFYQVSEKYTPEFERGVRWDDPAFGIEWPVKDPIVSDRDRSHPFYQRCGAGGSE